MGVIASWIPNDKSEIFNFLARDPIFMKGRRSRLRLDSDENPK